MRFTYSLAYDETALNSRNSENVEGSLASCETLPQAKKLKRDGIYLVSVTRNTYHFQWSRVTSRSTRKGYASEKKTIPTWEFDQTRQLWAFPWLNSLNRVPLQDRYEFKHKSWSLVNDGRSTLSEPSMKIWKRYLASYSFADLKSQASGISRLNGKTFWILGKMDEDTRRAPGFLRITTLVRRKKILHPIPCKVVWVQQWYAGKRKVCRREKMKPHYLLNDDAGPVLAAVQFQTVRSSLA